MGERGGASGRGRYAGKGGQQVESLFAEAESNKMIEAVYGSYGFWSWLRYWYLDTENFVELMLLDRVYQDYDYSEPEAKAKTELRPKSKEEIISMLARFGFKTKLTSEAKPMTAEEMQRIAMEDEKRETKQ